MSNAVYVITGGTFAGKTTTIAALRELGYNTFPEAAMEVIATHIEKHGYQESLFWRNQNQAAFQELIGKAQLKQEQSIRFSHNQSGSVYFLDRGTLDAIAYCRVLRVPPTHRLQQIAKESAAKYAGAFILDTLPEFNPRDGSGRICNQTDSESARKTIQSVYSEYGIATYVIPHGSVEERLAKIVEII